MTDFKKTTEEESLYQDIDKMSTAELLSNINREDQKVASVIEKSIPQIEKVVNQAYQKLSKGGRLFYIGAGTSGRLGIVDASECPPTFGVSYDLVIGLMAGGDGAMRKAVEFAEDDPHQAWNDLQAYSINAEDFIIGIAASGTTPYVIHGLKDCKKHDILTAGITCNEGSPLALIPDFPIVAVVGPEFITGSTRMKSGTAQKLILNMITTSIMVKLGRVKGNRMVDMQLSNNKLVDRGTKMIMDKTDLSYDDAQELLLKHGSVREALADV